MTRLNYRVLVDNPPKLTIKENPREVIFTTISAMCDNVHVLSLKKNSDGEFRLNGNGHALSNWQMKHDRYDIEWAADEGEWNKVVDMINTGTSVVGSVRSR